MSTRSRMQRGAYASSPATPNDRRSAKSPPRSNISTTWSWVAWVYRHVAVPSFHLVLSLVRGVTSIHASLSFCLMLLAGTACITGLGTLGALGMARHYTSVKSHIYRPLEFDYSQPVATAVVSLRDPPLSQTSFLSLLSHTLGYTQDSAIDVQLRNQYYNADVDSGGDAQYLPSQRAGGAGAAGGAGDGGGYGKVGRGAAGPGVVVQGRGRGNGKGGPETTRPLKTGQRVSVDVELELPAHHRDLFQVTAELLDDAGAVLARASRTHMMRSPPLLRSLIKTAFTLPAQVLGFSDSTASTKVRLVDTYVEGRDSPLTQVRVLLASRNASLGVLPPPPVFGGQVQVHIQLSLGQKLLSWLCPSWITSLVVASVAVPLTLASGAATLILGIVTMLLHRLRRHATPRRQPDNELLRHELARMVRNTQALLEHRESTPAHRRLTAPPPMRALIEEVSDDHELTSEDGHAISDHDGSDGGFAQHSYHNPLAEGQEYYVQEAGSDDEHMHDASQAPRSHSPAVGATSEAAMGAGLAAGGRGTEWNQPGEVEEDSTGFEFGTSDREGVHGDSGGSSTPWEELEEQAGQEGTGTRGGGGDGRAADSRVMAAAEPAPAGPAAVAAGAVESGGRGANQHRKGSLLGALTRELRSESGDLGAGRVRSVEGMDRAAPQGSGKDGVASGAGAISTDALQQGSLRQRPRRV